MTARAVVPMSLVPRRSPVALVRGARPDPRPQLRPAPRPEHRCFRCHEPGVTVIAVTLEDGTSVALHSCDRCDTRSWIYDDEVLALGQLTERLQTSGVPRRTRGPAKR